MNTWREISTLDTRDQDALWIRLNCTSLKTSKTVINQLLYA